MAYGSLKVDNIIFTNGGVDQTITVSGIVAATSGNLTVTGTISGAVVQGGTLVSGATVTGGTGQFTTLTGGTAGFTTVTGTTVTGTTANFVSGVFTTQISGATVTGTTANFASGVFTTQISGATVTGTTANFTSGNFTNISGGTHTITSGVFAAGSATNPSISFTSDPNTGIFSPGADQVAISTNGSGRLFVDSTGRIGINTSSPVDDFHISAGNPAIVLEETDAGTNQKYWRNRVDNNTFILEGLTDAFAAPSFFFRAIRAASSEQIDRLEFATSGTERMRLDSTGRLGLGTSSPTAKFVCDGSIQITSSTNPSTGAGLEIGYGTVNASRTALQSYNRTGSAWLGADYNALDHRFYISGGGSPQMTLTSTGLGIGTTSPAVKFQVSESSAGSVEVARFRIEGQTNNPMLRIFADEADQTVSLDTSGTTVGTQLVFRQGGNEAARIDGSRRLLIGTSTSLSAALIETAGTTFATSAILARNTANDTSPTGFVGAKIRGTSIVQSGDRVSAFIGRGYDGSAYREAAFMAVEIDGTPGANDMPGRLVFSTTADGASSPTERMRIDNSGRILINSSTTPAAATMLIRGGPAGTNAVHLQLTTATSTFGGGRISVTTTGGGLEFFTHTGNVGAETYTEAMRINSAQELLIGYTSDNGAYKLQVNSQIFATSATIATSDGRYKQNVATLGGCLGLVKALRPVSFTWKPQEDVTRIDDDGNEVLVREGHNFPEGTQVGFIAQEVQEVLADKPWLGSVIKENVRPAILDDDGNELAPEEQFYGIAEGNLIAVLTNALQEAVAEIESLKARLDAADL